MKIGVHLLLGTIVLIAEYAEPGKAGFTYLIEIVQYNIQPGQSKAAAINGNKHMVRGIGSVRGGQVQTENSR
jgi:hypothetical protein